MKSEDYNKEIRHYPPFLCNTLRFPHVQGAKCYVTKTGVGVGKSSFRLKIEGKVKKVLFIICKSMLSWHLFLWCVGPEVV